MRRVTRTLSSLGMLLWAAAAAAQVETATMLGTVADAQAGVLPCVTI